ncbi:hypothetical protein MHYP_G00293100 [Metynnis hypsauchen]
MMAAGELWPFYWRRNKTKSNLSVENSGSKSTVIKCCSDLEALQGLCSSGEPQSLPERTTKELVHPMKGKGKILLICGVDVVHLARERDSSAHCEATGREPGLQLGSEDKCQENSKR